MSATDRVRAMLDDEQQFIARKKEEITVDFPVIRAEIRAECLEQVLRTIDNHQQSRGTS